MINSNLNNEIIFFQFLKPQMNQLKCVIWPNLVKYLLTFDKSHQKMLFGKIFGQKTFFGQKYDDLSQIRWIRRTSHYNYGK